MSGQSADWQQALYIKIFLVHLLPRHNELLLAALIYN
jgi:hypothetical protein